MLKITNTLPNTKEILQPIKKNYLTLYVCGITPYDYPHIGHGRVYVVFDVLYRLLTFLGYKVTYCRNFTDIDDKLLKKSLQLYQDQMQYKQVAAQFMNAFKDDIAQLNCLPPTHEPLVTENIEEIISFIEKLIAKGNAYEAHGSVYFDISKFPAYGMLSKQNLDQLHAGARVEINSEKRSQLDFALWKKEDEGTFWKSPWGWGRPGWHIECSALAQKYLGEQIDIHGGGMDLIFPHHENEIAQSQALTNKDFVNLWMHCAFVRINKEKMSKSLGNFFTLRDIYKTIHPDVLRFYYLTHHYRSPLDFSFQDLEVAQKTYQKICSFFSRHTCANKAYTKDELFNIQVTKSMLDFLQDDLNTPGALGALFTYINQAQYDEKTICALHFILTEIFGLPLQEIPQAEKIITPEIQELIAQRDQARAQKNWVKADELRKQLEQLGVQVHDKKSS